ncbi:hypothetical protein [Streptomyces abyssomicinicus]|uniref:hypothetical protein n=1 Tax=Streptomyces abyssomicinicus TaxID=574929 RepID=UPI0012505F71|nr:hypothetical protein [Streptomyces abyssomicinicus]
MATLGACGIAKKAQVPHSLCRTKISPNLSAPLLGAGAVREWTSASFREPGSASWCVVYVDKKERFQLWFSAGGGKPNLMNLARSGPTIGLFDPHPVQGIGDQAVVANDGAIASTSCRDSAGADNFTLALKMAEGPMEPHRERDVERFMRAYMPATVKSLNCLAE